MAANDNGFAADVVADDDAGNNFIDDFADDASAADGIDFVLRRY